MMRNWKLIAILAFVLTSLGGLATWDEWKTKQDDKEKETKGKITSLKPEMISAISFHSNGDSEGGDKTPNAASDPKKAVDVNLKLKDGKWWLTSPISSLADQQVIIDLIKNITDYKTESEVASTKDKWASFGLENPRRKIELESTDGQKTIFLVGINSPVGFSVYTATNQSDTVFSGSQYISTSTGKTLFDLRDKKITDLVSSEVNEVKLTFVKEFITVKKADGKWTITSPSTTPGDTAAINNLVDDITGIKASEFLDTPDKTLIKAFNDKKFFAEIVISKDKSSTPLKIIEFKGATYASVNGNLSTIFKIADDIKSKISKTTKDLRDKKIMNFQSAQVEKITIDGENFKKIANDWYLEPDSIKFSSDGKFNGKPADQPKIQQHVRGLIVDLEYAKADDLFESNSQIAKQLPAAPKHHVTLNIAGSNAPILIDIWLAQDNPEMIYLKQSGSTQVFKAKRTTIANISPVLSKPAGNEAEIPLTKP